MAAPVGGLFDTYGKMEAPIGVDVERIRILIADDHTLVRDGTRRILEAEEDLEVVGEAGDGEEAVLQAARARPDVAIIDIAMPKLDGIEATRQIKSLCPRTAVLVLTAYDDDQCIFRLLEAGAAGYLLKSVRSGELVDAVRALHAGESVLHPTIARKVMDYFVSSPGKIGRQEHGDALTPREMDILRLVTRGLSNKEIADELVLSMRTVQGHLRSIFGKLGVGSRTEAVVRALKEGWVTLRDVP
jgi:DNA-binding NarL/FixJ family response regulator